MWLNDFMVLNVPLQTAGIFLMSRYLTSMPFGYDAGLM